MELMFDERLGFFFYIASTACIMKHSLMDSLICPILIFLRVSIFFLSFYPGSSNLLLEYKDFAVCCRFFYTNKKKLASILFAFNAKCDYLQTMTLARTPQEMCIVCTHCAHVRVYENKSFCVRV